MHLSSKITTYYKELVEQAFVPAPLLYCFIQEQKQIC